MWTAVFFICGINLNGDCVQTGPQLIFPTEDVCEHWSIEQMDQLDGLEAKYKCLNWDDKI